MLKPLTVESVLDQDGILANLPNYSFRLQQLEMATKVAATIADCQQLIVEAGTGTGKTFAYLVPALLSGKKVIVSTATKNLQDQLFARDLPTLLKILNYAIKVAHLKGRSNYLCLQRLNTNLSEGRFKSRQMVIELHQAREWSLVTETGDLADMAELADNAAILPFITSSADNCLGQECPHAANCFLLKARKKAMQADLVIINHHLFFADHVIRDNGFKELLPNFDVVIFDEAHHLAEIASNFFAISLSSRQFFALAHDCEAEASKNSLDLAATKQLTDKLYQAVASVQQALGLVPRRAPWATVAQATDLQQALADLVASLQELIAMLELVAGKARELQRCWERTSELLQKLTMLQQRATTDYIHWFEVADKNFAIYLTPLNIASHMQNILLSDTAWIFTSATLAVNGSFQHYQRDLGLTEAQTLLLASPFNYREQALFYVPRELPDPRQDNYIRAIIDEAVPVINACGGRTFFLFTSHKMLQRASELLPVYLNYPLLVQGSTSKKNLLNQFHDLGNAVLLGTNSFWEGVDVRGEKLSCVIIDKLPFAVPTDPVVKARIDALDQAGGNAFIEYQLPHAVLALKQGAGRLIRDQYDRGILMICDPRLINKAYGKVFINSLPRMRRTRDLQLVRDFFDE